MHLNPPPDDIIVDVRGVTYTHWNQTAPTLKQISLQVRRGTLNVLVGPSGSGKSTLCDLFNGVIPHLNGGKFEGEVWVDGLEVSSTEVKVLSQRVGRVFQDPEIMFAMLYVDDEIAFGPENLRMDPVLIRDTVENLLKQTDLVSRRKNLVWNLSGGQVQKLGLATVLAMHPKMIVLDEPTSNLDPGATRSVHDLVLSLRDQGITVLLVTRELDDFLAKADQLLVMSEGTIQAADTPRQVLRQYGHLLLESLGVWLPETSEIGIELIRQGLVKDEIVPITISETFDLLSENDLLAAIAANHDVKKKPEKQQQPATLISASDLRYTYPGEVEALKGISFDIHAGEWLMILGRNGAGKSTLAQLLVGLLKAPKGSLEIFNKDSQDWKVQELANHIALVFQNPEHQFLTDSVSDEISYSLLAQGISDPDEVDRRTKELLYQLGLADFPQTHPFALSAGLKRRLGVATMLVGNPQILLVDEPTYGQDRQMTHTLMAFLKKINKQGVTVVMITHDMRLVQEYAGRVVVMSDGCILWDGDSTGLFDREEILLKANLRRTLLWDLLENIEACGFPIQEQVRTPAELINLIKKNVNSGEFNGK